MWQTLEDRVIHISSNNFRDRKIIFDASEISNGLHPSTLQTLRFRNTIRIGDTDVAGHHETVLVWIGHTWIRLTFWREPGFQCLKWMCTKYSGVLFS